MPKTVQFQIIQFSISNLINFSTSVWCCHWFYLPSVQRRHSCILPASRKETFLLCLNYFFLVNSTSSCVSRMILLAVCTSNFFQALSLCMELPRQAIVDLEAMAMKGCSVFPKAPDQTV